jgi:hypothetical protein
MKPCKPLDDPQCPKLIQNDDTLIVLHSSKPFVVSVRKGHIRLTDLGAANSKLVSVASFMTGFLTVDQKQEALTLTRYPLGFDIRKHQKLADGYFLKQSCYKDRGIKLLKVFNPSLNPKDKEYLLITTFQLKKPAECKPENGFTADTKALVYQYKIDIFAMPKSGNWKEFSQNFEPTKTVVQEKLAFNEN